ncbi:hypothetical protein V6N13_136557 [Hibiscus sabdariffa]
MGFLSFAGKLLELGKKKERGGGNGGLGNRWSDCGCDSCVSWIKESNQRLHVVVTEFPQAWHNMHNVICGGSKFMDDYVEILVNAKVKVRVIHGDQDSTTPLQGSNNLKTKFPQVELNIVRNADHSSVILDRKRDFAKTLQHIWAASTYD